MDLDDSNRVEILETATVILLNMGFPARQKDTDICGKLFCWWHKNLFIWHC